MEITASTIYWITRLDILKGLFIILTATGTCAAGLAVVVAIVDEGDNWTQSIVKRVLKFSIPALLVGFLGLAFVPSTEQAAAMWVVPKVANGESISSAGTNVLHLIDINLNLNNLKGGH